MIVKCPKCGFEQLEDEFCARCGIHMPSYTPSQKWNHGKFLVATGLFLLISLSISLSYWFFRETESQKKSHNPPPSRLEGTISYESKTQEFLIQQATSQTVTSKVSHETHLQESRHAANENYDQEQIRKTTSTSLATEDQNPTLQKKFLLSWAVFKEEEFQSLLNLAENQGVSTKEFSGMFILSWPKNMARALKKDNGFSSLKLIEVTKIQDSPFEWTHGDPKLIVGSLSSEGLQNTYLQLVLFNHDGDVYLDFPAPPINFDTDLEWQGYLLGYPIPSDWSEKVGKVQDPVLKKISGLENQNSLILAYLVEMTSD